ncbi:MAG: phosphoglucosamine mutase, partial [Alphaproteobacteria bacterium]
GIISALQILAIMKETGKSLSELASFVKMAPQELLNVKVSSKPEIDDIPGLNEAIKAAEAELGREGRVLVRYSGTEKICRVMVEATTDDMVRKWSSQLATIVRDAIG